MIDAFKIGAILELKSNAAGRLQEMARLFGVLDKAVEESKRNIAEFDKTVQDLSTRARSMNRIAAGLREIGAATSTMSGAAGAVRGFQSLAQSLTALSAGSAGVLRLSTALGRMQRVTLGPPAGIDNYARALQRLAHEEPAMTRLGAAMTAMASAIRAAINGSTALTRVGVALARMENARMGIAATSLQRYASILATIAGYEPAMTALATAMITLGRARPPQGSALAAATTAAGAGPVPPGQQPGGAQPGNKSPWRQHLSEHDFSIVGHSLGQGGRKTLGLTGRAVDSAFGVEHLRQLLLTDDRINEQRANQAVSAAFEATKTAPGTTPTENLKALLDLKNLTGDLEEAEHILPRFARLAAALSVVDRARGGKGDPAFAAGKAMDILGASIEEVKDPKTGQNVRQVNPDLLMQRLELLQRVVVATGGRVDPATYLRFAKQGEVPGMLMSDEFLYEKLPALLMAMPGDRVGTMFTSMRQVFAEGRMTDKSYDALAAIGLAGPATERMVIDPLTKKRKTVRDEPGVYDLDILKRDPLEYAQAAIRRMEAHGITDTNAQIDAITKASQRATIARMLAMLIKDMPGILREQQNIQHTRMDSFNQLVEKDPVSKMAQLHASWEKLMNTFGGTLVDQAIEGLTKLTSALETISAWASANPETAQTLSYIATGLGTLGIALGALSTAVYVLGPAIRILMSLGGIAGTGAAAVAGGIGAAATGAGGAAAGAAGAAAAGVGAGTIAAGALGAAAIGGAAYMGWKGAVASGTEVAKQGEQGKIPYLVDEFGNANDFRAAPPSIAPKKKEDSGPQDVRVVNPGDLATGVSGAITNRLGRPPSGVTSPDLRIDLTPAYGGL